MDSNDEKFMLDKHQAAALVGCSVRTLDRWAGEKRGPVFQKIGSLRRYKKSAVLAWIERQPTGGEQMEAA